MHFFLMKSTFGLLFSTFTQTYYKVWSQSLCSKTLMKHIEFALEYLKYGHKCIDKLTISFWG